MPLTVAPDWWILGGMRTALLALVLTCGSGCGSTGLVVVNVASDGAGMLVIQRCAVEANLAVRLRSCKFEEVRVSPKPKRRTSWTFTPDGKAREPDPD